MESFINAILYYPRNPIQTGSYFIDDKGRDFFDVLPLFAVDTMKVLTRNFYDRTIIAKSKDASMLIAVDGYCIFEIEMKDVPEEFIYDPYATSNKWAYRNNEFVRIAKWDN